jgi:hypothetical protein
MQSVSINHGFNYPILFFNLSFLRELHLLLLRTTFQFLLRLTRLTHDQVFIAFVRSMQLFSHLSLPSIVWVCFLGLLGLHNNFGLFVKLSGYLSINNIERRDKGLIIRVDILRRFLDFFGFLIAPFFSLPRIFDAFLRVLNLS